MKHNLHKIIFGVLSLLAMNLSGQQLHRHNWFFGESDYVLRFDFGNNEVYVDSIDVQLAQGGHVTASDPVSGNVLFYASGQNIYDASNQRMSTIDLGGELGNNQPVVSFAFPGSQDQYYLIAKGPQSGMFYNVVNMSLQGNASSDQTPLGALEVANTPLSFLNNPTEGMIAIQGQDSLYVIAQSVDNLDQLFILSFGANVNPGISTFQLPNAIEIGNMSYTSTAGRLALAPQEPGQNVMILDVDLQSDTILSFSETIFNSGFNDTGEQNIYDTEWSPDGTKIYLSRYGSNGTNANIYQYDFAVNNFIPQEIMPASVFESFGLQIGPDGNIYHLYRESVGGDIRVGRIIDADSALVDVGYEYDIFPGINFNSRQFATPALPYQTNNTIDFTYRDSCERNTVKFFPEFEPEASQVFWDFGDGNTSSAHSPVHRYENPQPYQVQLSALINGEVVSTTQTVDIIPNQDSVFLGQDTVICPGETLTLDATENLSRGPGNYDYFWSDGSTGSTLDVDSAGTYWVAVTSSVDLGGNGCTVYDEIEITVYGDEEQTANQWYFGQNAGIDFNDGASPLDDGAMITPEGAATISDQNGDLLFYTDGQNVYNRDHQLMSSTLNGSPGATQSAVIVPFGDDNTMYYIFTTREIPGDLRYELYYSVVDMKVGPNGTVVIENVLLSDNNTERIAAAGTDALTWVMAHDFGSNGFRAYPVTPEGLGAPIRSNAGTVHSISDALNGQGYMKFSTDLSKLAVAIPSSGGGNDLLEIFDFVDSTGSLENPISIPLNESAGQLAYGVEFSSGVSKVFVSVSGTTSNIREYFIDTANVEVIRNSGRELNGTFTGEIGALQVGPDGRIYVAVNNSAILGTINENENFDEVSVYVESGFNLAGGTQSQLGLPNFIQNNASSNQGPSITVADNCLGQSTSFSGSGTSTIDELFWTFGDGNSASGETATHTYAIDSLYLVSLNITNRCGLDTTLTQEVSIFQEAPSPTIVDTFFCRDQQVLLNANQNNINNLSFLWNTGDTTNLLLIDEQGEYSVTITDENGCTASESITTNTGGPEMNLGPDLVFCQNEPGTVLDAQDVIPAYEWYINGNPETNTSSRQPIITNTAGVFTYIGVGTDPASLGGCSNSDTVEITVNATPDLTLDNAIDPDNCSNGTGSISLTDDGSASFAWTGPGGYTNDSASINSLVAGTYSITATNDANGCTADSAFTVADVGSSFNASLLNALPGCEDDGQLEFTVDISGDYTYELINTSNGERVTAGAITASTTIPTITGLAAGSYILNVTDAGGCLDSATAVLNELDEIEITVAEGDFIFACGPSAQINVSSPNDPSVIFTWTTFDGGAANPLNGSPITAVGSGNYVVNASGSLCSSSDTIRVNVSDVHQLRVNETGNPCNGETLLDATITPVDSNGPFRYAWSRGGQQVAQTEDLTVTQSGSYSLTVIDQSTGCEATDGPFDITISEPFTVNLISPSFCDNDSLLIQAVTDAINPSYTWIFNGSPSQNLTGESFPVNALIDSARLRVDVTNTDNCVVSDSIDIIRLAFTPSELVDNILICPADPDNASVELNPGNFTRYEWILPDGGTSTASVINANVEGTYSATLTNAFGCLTFDEVFVTEQCTPIVAAPTAFNPISNVTANRAFVVRTVFVDQFEIFIYNRWGEPVFNSTDPSFEWFGDTDTGDALPSGTYAYTIRFTGVTDDVERTQRGIVTLIR